MTANTVQQDGSLEDQLRAMMLANSPVSSQQQRPQSMHQLNGRPAFPDVDRLTGPGSHRPRQHQHRGSSGAPPIMGRPFHNQHAHHQHHHSHHNQPPHHDTNRAPPPGHQLHPGPDQGFPKFHQRNLPMHPQGYGPPHQRMNVDPNAFQRGPPRGGAMQPRQPRQLYQPQFQPLAATSGPQYDSQWQYLEAVVAREVPLVEMSAGEIGSKDSFRLHLESVCQSLKVKYVESGLPSVTLQSFGSLSSGFASSGSDMDLAIVTDSLDSAEQPVPMHETNLPRLLEKELLDRNIGARLLTRTRVPIIKVCEKPTPELLQALREERQKWEDSPDEDKNNSSQPSVDTQTPKVDIDASLPVVDRISESNISLEVRTDLSDNHSSHHQSSEMSNAVEHVAPVQANSGTDTPQQANGNPPKSRNARPWTRERVAGPLDFPKQGVGIQCDINFFNPLGLYNTKLLRCYSKCDPRVRPMILFVKAWAKRRRINSSYSGTLSSYGYVLMVLHYLVNVVHPPVLPNLQLQAAHTGLPGVKVDGWEVRFFGDEDEIGSSAAKGLLTQNRDPVGMLLRGFFQYFASTSGGQGFIWMQDVLSLRSPGGLMKKEEKGWTGAKTEVGDNVSAHCSLHDLSLP